MVSVPPSPCRPVFALAIFLTAFAPLHAHAAGDLHDLYGALQIRGHAVTIPGKLLARLGLPATDIAGKEIAVTEIDQDRRGITAFQIAGVPYLTMFHIEPGGFDAWWLRFSLDGRVLNEKWGQEGYGTYDMPSAGVAEREVDFWRRRLGAKPSP